MKKIVRLTESDLTRLVKRVIRESRHSDIEIGDEVFIPHMEYSGEVVGFNRDMTKVKIDGPMGIEFFNIDDVEKNDRFSGEEDF